MSFRSDAKALAYQAGGSYKTIHDRQLAVARFADYLQRSNIQIRSIDHLKGRHVAGFVEARIAAGISLRTIQNEITGIRTILREANRDKLADQLRTKDLGIGGASRDGSKVAMSDERFSGLHAVVLVKDAGVAAVIELQRVLGLRAEEGVKACKSLATWERELSAGRPVRVVFGTKGGRPRDVSPANRDRALAAVRAARALAARQAGVLVNRPDERQAMNRYRNVLYSAGATGRESGHSLRYAFAQEQMRAYIANGYSRREALALTSMDLGHGDGRGRYIEQVYGQQGS